LEELKELFLRGAVLFIAGARERPAARFAPPVQSGIEYENR
jgi:hypothetical protein